MLVRFTSLLIPLTLGLSGLAAAEDRPIVVELFASQNCPACPQAHRTMKAVAAEEEDVLVLTWSVDYWDYLGEPDPMAMPEAKARQADYVEKLALRAPYTPQSIYNGVKECPGPRRKDVERNISTLKQSMAPSAFSLATTEDGFSISGRTDRPVTLNLIHYLADDAHDTGMVNPVTGEEVLAEWHGGSASFELACKTRCAVLAQDTESAEILDAIQIQ